MPDVTIAGDDPVIDRFAVEGRPSGGGRRRKGYGLARYSGLSGSKPMARFARSAVAIASIAFPQAIPRGPSLARRRDNHTAKVRISLKTIPSQLQERWCRSSRSTRTMSLAGQERRLLATVLTSAFRPISTGLADAEGDRRRCRNR
jgi:hypothetical protein